jgi:hypothetical protein
MKVVHTKSSTRFKIDDIGKNTQLNHIFLSLQFHIKHRHAFFALAQHFVGVDVVHIYIDRYMHVGGLKKSTHLAYYPMNELDLEEEALVPRTNLA